jgi:hypothetical protein
VYVSFNAIKKQQFINETIKCLELNTKAEVNTRLLIDLSKLFNKYNLNFTEEFNKIILSIHVVDHFGKELSQNVKACQTKVLNELDKFNKLISI